VYYVASYLFPARDTYVDGLISADDVMPIDKQYEKDEKSPTETTQSGTEGEEQKSVNVETAEVQV
jgi:NCS1 family nucleobase:cation symporter-1